MDSALLQNLLADAFSNIVQYTAAQLQRVAAEASSPSAVVTSSAAGNPCHQLLGDGFGARPETGSWGDAQMQLQLQQLQLQESVLATLGLPAQQHTAALALGAATAAAVPHKQRLAEQISPQQKLAVRTEAAEAAGRSCGRGFAGNSSEPVSEQLLRTRVIEEEQLLEAEMLDVGQVGPSGAASVSNSPPAAGHRARSTDLSHERGPAGSAHSSSSSPPNTQR